MRVVGPLWKHSFVQIHQHNILRLDLSIEHALHVPMSAQWFLDVSSASILGPQLHWPEPTDVLAIEEHESHHSRSLVNLQQVSTQYHSFHHNSVRINRQNTPSCNWFLEKL